MLSAHPRRHRVTRTAQQRRFRRVEVGGRRGPPPRRRVDAGVVHDGGARGGAVALPRLLPL